MHFTLSSRPLVEIEIRLHTELIRAYLFSRGGLWRHLTLAIITLFLVLMAPALQAGLPQSFPELPLVPLAWATAYLASRRSALLAYVGALLSGLTYDIMLMQPWGRTSALLLVVAIFANCLPKPAGQQTWHGYYDLLQGAVATLVFQTGKITFLAGEIPWATRVSMMPKQLLGATAMAMVTTPLIFAAIDGWEKILTGKKQS